MSYHRQLSLVPFLSRWAATGHPRMVGGTLISALLGVRH